MPADQLKALQEMRSHKPFVPFRIVTTNGEEHLVTDRFQFAVYGTRVLCHLLPELRRSVELTADQIAAVKPLEEKPAA